MDNGNMPVMGGKIPKSEREIQQEQALYRVKPDPYTYQKGLTKREHFAGLAMQGLLSGPTVVPDSKGIAICAVDMADALLKELSK